MESEVKWIRDSGSCLVAITRWEQAPEEELTHLASLLGVTAYDLRLRIMGPPPVVLAGRLSSDSARQLLKLVRARGHGAVVCDHAQVRACEQMYLPRDFSFGPESLTLTDNSTSPGSIIGYDQMTALVMATRTVEVHSEEQQTKKKFSVTRAIASGGLVRSRKVKMQVHTEDGERESVLYMFCSTEPKQVFFQESRLHYVGLGKHRGPSRPENFKTFVRLLRQKAAGVVFDESMFRRMRQTRFASSTGVAKSLTAVHSNASQNDLAAWLIVIGLLKGQM